MNLDNWHKFRLAQKLWFGFGLLILILAVTVIVAYWQSSQANERLNQITNVQIPSEQAVFGMKASVTEITQSLQDYFRDRSPAHLEQASKSESTFESLIAEFKNTANDDQIKQLGQQVSDLFAESSGLRSEITTLFAQQSTELKALLKNIGGISEVVDNRLIPQIDPTDPHAATKLEAAFGLEFDILTISTAINEYSSKPDATLQNQIQDAQVDFHSRMGIYRETAALTALEESWLDEIDDDFNDAISDMSNIVTLSDNLDKLLVQHEEDTSEIVAILENEIQPLVNEELAESTNNAGNSLGAVRTWAIILGVLGLAFGSVLAWIVSRRVVRSLQNLQRIAKSVADGKLDQRFYIDAKDEFGVVARTLNQMLENIGRSREALGESEETAWQLLDATTDSVILMDLRGTILATNEVASTRFERSLEQMIDASYYDLLPADLMAARKSQIAEVIKTGKPLHFEEDRKGMVLDTRIFPVIDPKNGRVARISIFARDITTRKWVEEVTEHLGHRNELILAAAGEGIYGLDNQGKTTFVNPAAAKMLGYEPGELIGQYHHELVHYSKPNGMPYPSQQCPIYAAFKDGVVRTNVNDEVFWRKDGTSFQVEYTSNPIIEDGNVVGAVVTFRDITERKKIETALRRTEERYRSIFESPLTLIISVDNEGVIIDCNARVQKMLGYLPDEVVGQSMLQFVQREYHTVVQGALNELVTKGIDYNKRYKMIRKDGTAIDVNVNAASVRNERGEYIRTICMIDEVTEKVEI